jgi:antitoxin StbD
MARGRSKGSILPAPPDVETVRDAKSHLSDYLRDARELGAEARPRFFGAHRRPEAVVLSFEGWLQMSDAVENQEIAALVASRSAARGSKSVELDAAMEMLGLDPNEHAPD